MGSHVKTVVDENIFCNLDRHVSRSGVVWVDIFQRESCTVCICFAHQRSQAEL